MYFPHFLTPSEKSKLKPYVTEILEVYKNKIMTLRDTSLRFQVAQWFAYNILFSTRYNVTHDFDPDWDSSGTLIKDYEKNDFDLNDYLKVQNFLEEYTGSSQPTFNSGNGMYHEVYEDQLTEIIRDFFCEIHQNLYQSFSFEDDVIKHIHYIIPLSPNEFFDEIYEKFDFCSVEMDFEFELIKYFGDFDALSLFNEGKIAAYNQKRKNKERQRRELIIYNFKKESADQLFVEFTKIFKDKYTVDLPSHIGKNNEMWQSIKKVLESFNSEQQALIVWVGPFSNSIKEYYSKQG